MREPVWRFKRPISGLLCRAASHARLFRATLEAKRQHCTAVTGHMFSTPILSRGTLLPCPWTLTFSYDRPHEAGP